MSSAVSLLSPAAILLQQVCAGDMQQVTVMIMVMIVPGTAAIRRRRQKP